MRDTSALRAAPVTILVILSGGFAVATTRRIGIHAEFAVA